MSLSTNEFWHDMVSGDQDFDSLYDCIVRELESWDSYDTLIFYQPKNVSFMAAVPSKVIPRQIYGPDNELNNLNGTKISECSQGLQDSDNFIEHLENAGRWLGAIEGSGSCSADLRSFIKPVSSYLNHIVSFHEAKEKTLRFEYFDRFIDVIQSDSTFDQSLNEILSILEELNENGPITFYDSSGRNYRLRASNESPESDALTDRKLLSGDEFIQLKQNSDTFYLDHENENSMLNIFLPIGIGDREIGLIGFYNYRISGDKLSEFENWQFNTLTSLLSFVFDSLEFEFKSHDQITHDNLTGLKSSKYLSNRLDQEIERARRYESPFSFMVLEIENLEDLKENYGKILFDEVLQKIGRIIETSVRTIDICGRMENDDIGFIFPHTDMDEAIEVAQRLRELIQNPFMTFQTDAIDIDISLGLSGFPVDGDEANTLIKKARLALYEAKQMDDEDIQTTLEIEPSE